MTILLILALVLVVGIYRARTGDYYESEKGVIVAIIAGVCLVIALVLIPLSRMGARAEMAQFRAVAETGEVAREASDPLERAAWTQKVSEANEWLASAQYWSQSVFAIYWPREVNDLEPIR